MDGLTRGEDVLVYGVGEGGQLGGVFGEDSVEIGIDLVLSTHAFVVALHAAL